MAYIIITHCDGDAASATAHSRVHFVRQISKALSSRSQVSGLRPQNSHTHPHFSVRATPIVRRAAFHSSRP
jgi:hypothetical protein